MKELLLTLAEEIRQTALWLGQEEEPSNSNIRFRLRTLREAASMARMNAVGDVLADLEQKLAGPQPVALEVVLAQLSDLLVTLAEPAEARELEWVAQMGSVEADLERLIQELGHCAERLDRLGASSDRAVVAQDQEQRSELCLEVGRGLRQEQAGLQTWRREASATADRLRNAGRRLMRELAATHRIPLDPTFARLRERVRRWSRANSIPVSLQSRARLDVSVRQYEPLVRVIEGLVEQILDHGLEDPKRRRKAGKATVANIVIGGERHGSLLQLELEDDGRTERGGPAIDDALRADLEQLRARLFVDTEAGDGQRLVLQLPMWYSSLEALPVECDIGTVLVPLSVVDRLSAGDGVAPADLPSIQLDRRSAGADRPDEAHGLVCRVGDWIGWLPGQISGPVIRVVAQPAGEQDPVWIIGRVNQDRQAGPVLHPLPFVTPPTGWRAIFPADGDG